MNIRAKTILLFLFPVLITTVWATIHEPLTASANRNCQNNQNAANQQGSPSSAAPSPTHTTQSTEKALRRAEAAKLLDQAPMLDPRPKDALSDNEFIAATEKLLDKKVKNVNDAVEELEEAIRDRSRSGGFWSRTSHKVVGWILYPVNAGSPEPRNVGSVTAVVTSSPSSLDVRYYRATHPEKKLDTVTDNSNVELDPPAHWIFECTRNGVTKTQRKSCTSGCTVHFVF